MADPLRVCKISWRVLERTACRPYRSRHGLQYVYVKEESEYDRDTSTLLAEFLERHLYYRFARAAASYSGDHSAAILRSSPGGLISYATAKDDLLANQTTSSIYTQLYRDSKSIAGQSS